MLTRPSHCIAPEISLTGITILVYDRESTFADTYYGASIYYGCGCFVAVHLTQIPYLPSYNWSTQLSVHSIDSICNLYDEKEVEVDRCNSVPPG